MSENLRKLMDEFYEAMDEASLLYDFENVLSEDEKKEAVRLMSDYIQIYFYN